MLKWIRPIVFVDLETTGTNTQKDRIVEIACVKLMSGGDRIVKTYRINPGIHIPESASAIHGITDDDVKDSPTFSQLAKGLLEFIEGCDIAGFKSNNFDCPMLYAEFSRAKIDWDYNKHSLIDVGNIFIIQEPRTLAAAVRFYCNRDLEGAHGAEADIMATVDVFERQLQRYDTLPDTVEELALFSNYGKKRLDMAGKFTLAPDGETILFNFGANNGKPAKDDFGFLRWMVYKADFPKDTVAIARKILGE